MTERSKRHSGGYTGYDNSGGGYGGYGGLAMDRSDSYGSYDSYGYGGGGCCGHSLDLTDLLLGLGLAAAAGAAGFFFGQTQRGRSFPLLSPFSADENPALTILKGIDDFAKKLEDYAKE